MITFVSNMASCPDDHASSFQLDIYEHWKSIRSGGSLPEKKFFRPQNFARFLPQVAIISVDNHGCHDRLTGTTITDMLKLSNKVDAFVEPRDDTTRQITSAILSKCRTIPDPLYIEGVMDKPGYLPIYFSTVTLPMVTKADSPDLDTIILAFEFERRAPDRFFAVGNAQTVNFH